MISTKRTTSLLLIVLSTLLFSLDVFATGNRLTHQEATCSYNKVLPDSSCTPGESAPQVTQGNINDTICVPGYSKKVRPGINITGPIKKDVMKAYGNTVAQPDNDLEVDCSELTTNKSVTKSGSKCFDLSQCKDHSNNFKCYELDHLISLELGGCPDCKTNLWPEPYNPKPGAHDKDQVENYLHKKVCDGGITLEDAQTIISRDWFSCYEKRKAHQECN